MGNKSKSGAGNWKSKRNTVAARLPGRVSWVAQGANKTLWMSPSLTSDPFLRGVIWPSSSRGTLKRTIPLNSQTGR